MKLINIDTARRIIDSPRNKTQMLAVLEMTPAVDAVEVVRCKDCIWKYDHNCTRAVEIWIDDEDFCSFAERRQDETY